MGLTLQNTFDRLMAIYTQAQTEGEAASPELKAAAKAIGAFARNNPDMIPEASLPQVQALTIAEIDAELDRLVADPSAVPVAELQVSLAYLKRNREAFPNE